MYEVYCTGLLPFIANLVSPVNTLSSVASQNAIQDHEVATVHTNPNMYSSFAAQEPRGKGQAKTATVKLKRNWISGVMLNDICSEVFCAKLIV